MEVVFEKSGYKIEFNGSKSYLVTDGAGQCLFATQSKVKAINKIKSIFKGLNIEM